MNDPLHAAMAKEVNGSCVMRLLLAMTIAGAVAMSSGCAAEDKNPRTVTEFLKMPRVGEVQP